jgi:hypothetical protein
MSGSRMCQYADDTHDGFDRVERHDQLGGGFDRQSNLVCEPPEELFHDGFHFPRARSRFAHAWGPNDTAELRSEVRVRD